MRCVLLGSLLALAAGYPATAAPKTRSVTHGFIRPRPGHPLGAHRLLGEVRFERDSLSVDMATLTVDLGGDEEVIECVNNLLAAHQIPREKYADPQTSSQEVGWFTEPFVPRNPRFFHGLNQSEATKFAELYTQKMAGDHMYKNYKSSGMKF